MYSVQFRSQYLGHCPLTHRRTGLLPGGTPERGAKVGHRVSSIDYTATIEIEGGATLTLHGNGQFIQLNVLDVVEVKQAVLEHLPPAHVQSSDDHALVLTSFHEPSQRQ